MAEYKDLYDLRSNDGLRNKVAVATIIAAESLLAGSPTVDEASWAYRVISNPNGDATAILNLVLAANKDATVIGITGAGDVAIQSNVDAVVSGLIIGRSA